MPIMNLSEEEAKVIRRQFGVYMCGNFTADNMFLSEGMTMHTDAYTDCHTDTHSEGPPPILPIPNFS